MSGSVEAMDDEAKVTAAATADPQDRGDSRSVPNRAQTKKFKDFIARHNAMAGELKFLPLGKRRRHEGTRSPVFVLESRVFEMAPHEIPAGFRSRSDGAFDQVLDDLGNEFEASKRWTEIEMRRRYPNLFREAWSIAGGGVWLTREEAEAFGAEHEADLFPNGFRARPISANGLLEELINVL